MKLPTFLIAIAALVLGSPGARAATEASTDLASRLDVLEQYVRPYNQGVKPASECDWEKAGREVAAIAADNPEATDYRLRNISASALRGLRKFTPERVGVVEKLFAGSPNTLVREMASGEAHIADARSVPMEMKFTALDGREVDLEKLRGKVVLLDFWAATWCGACKVQEPLMKEVYAAYHGRGFEIIGIACEYSEKDRAVLARYVQEHGMPWPQYFDGKGMDNPYSRRFGLISLPQYFLLGKDGRLVAHTESSGGLRYLEEVLRRELGLAPLQPGDETRVLGAREPVPKPGS